MLSLLMTIGRKAFGWNIYLEIFDGFSVFGAAIGFYIMAPTL